MQLPELEQRYRCRHCGAERGLTGRRLCSRCYADLQIRKLYPLVRGLLQHSDHAGDFNESAALPDQLTLARPGSEEKIAVLTERASREQELWHPEDGALWKERG
jgi:hypothetical protein